MGTPAGTMPPETAAGSSLVSTARSSETEDAIRKHEEAATDLAKKGSHTAALKEWETALEIANNAPDEDDGACVWRLCKHVGTTCNAIAMASLQHGDEDGTMNLLRRALQMSQVVNAASEKDISRLKLRAVTYNNIGCFYRKMDRPKEALLHLERALKLLNEIPHAEHAADTHLNICAVLSQLGRHSQALEHAQVGLILLQEELYFAHESDEAPEEMERHNQKRYPVLTIAYHNVAVEQEFIGRVQEALTSYQKAAQVATEHVGQNHPITASVLESLAQAKATWVGNNPADSKGSSKSCAAGASSSTKSALKVRSKQRPKSAKTSRNRLTGRSKTTISAIERLSRGQPSVRLGMGGLSSSRSKSRAAKVDVLGAIADAEALYGNSYLDNELDDASHDEDPEPSDDMSWLDQTAFRDGDSVLDQSDL